MIICIFMLVCIYIYTYIYIHVSMNMKSGTKAAVLTVTVRLTPIHTRYTHIGLCKAEQRQMCSHLLRTRHTFTRDTHIYRNV